MLALGTSLEDAQEILNLKWFRGRLAIAAHNSSASVTLSGDADAIVHAKNVFDDEKKFARLLKVDTAYYSHHMLPCSDSYVQALQACGVQVNKERSNTSCSWFSSVIPNEEAMNPIEELQDVYWRDNMTNTVLFADAVKFAVASDEQICLAIEVGPHPALKGPAMQIISDVRSAPVPYCGALSRGNNDIEAFSDALGSVWTHLGNQGLNLQSYEKNMIDQPQQPKLVVGLSVYQWNHERSHWSESRVSRETRGRKQPPHELLGVQTPDSNGRDLRWSNVLKVAEIPWLDHHQLQGQTVFPAAGYVAMALEASRIFAADKTVHLFELHNLSIPRAITFEEGDNLGVETLVTLTAIQHHQDQTITADFSCYSIPVASIGLQQGMELMASGTVNIVVGTPSVAALSCKPLEDYNMSTVNSELFYSSLSKLGYGYAGSFRGMSSLKRRLNQSSVIVDTYPYAAADTTVYLVHPSILDVAFQSSMLAYSAPGDERLWSLHVPTAIRSIRVNPAVCSALPESKCQVSVCAVLDNESKSFLGSIDLFSEDGQHGMFQIEEFTIKPFASATESDDRRLFTYTKFDFAAPDGSSIVENIRPSADEVELATVCERIAYYYVRKWQSEITNDDWTNGQPHHLHLRNWVNHTLSTASRGQHPTLRKEWSEDSPEYINTLISKYPDSVDVRLLSAVGENIPAAVRGQTTILEHMLPDNLLDDFYKQGVGIHRYNLFLASMVKQITHRYPHANILEIGKTFSDDSSCIFILLISSLGAGTGGATKSVLEGIGNQMSSYTYTDISVGFFNKAAELFKAYSDKMTFKVLDVEKPPAAQGYRLHSYNIIIASNVLHATVSLQTTLENTRQLLKPGGYLMLLEITNQGPIRFGNVMAGLSGWWLGVDDGRKHAPTVTPGDWHNALRKAGFSGVDAITPEVDGITWPLSIIAAQAVDDRMQLLRRPLAPPSPAVSIKIESLIILGNQTLETSRIAEEVADYLGRFCGELTILKGLPTETEALDLSPMSTFINLVDIDSPIFKNITTEKMEGLKRVFELANHVLWITQGAQMEQPYHMASIAFSRAIRNEAGHVSLNHLDVSGLPDNVSKLIAEYLLQQRALDEWDAPTFRDGQQHPQLLWSKEPEAFLDRGRLKVPRLISLIDQNARLNAAKRITTKTVEISQLEMPISLSLNSDLQPSLVEAARLATRKSPDARAVRVESSSLMAICVDVDTFFFLGVGREHTSQAPVVLLSTTNSCDTTPVASVAGKLDADGTTKSADHLLVAVASEILAESLIQPLSSGRHILVHCSGQDRFFTTALSRRAATKKLRVTFVCDKEGTEDVQDPAWIKLSARSPKHMLQRMLRLAKPTHFLDLTTPASSSNQPSVLSLRIIQALPSDYTQISLTTLFQHKSSLPSWCDREVLVGRLNDAVSRARSLMISTPQEHVQDLVIQLDQINDPSVLNHVTR